MDTKNTYRFKLFDMIAMYFIVAGAINWGVVGFLGVDLVAKLFGEMTLLSRFVYMLMGVSAIYHVASYKITQRRWECNTNLRGASTTPIG